MRRKHYLRRPCPIAGGAPIHLMWSDPALPEWPDNACRHCTGDVRTVGDMLSDLARQRDAHGLAETTFRRINSTPANPRGFRPLGPQGARP